MNGEVVAAHSSHDDSLLLRRIRCEGALPLQRVAELSALAGQGESVFGILLEEVDPELMERVLFERFRDNLATFLGQQKKPRFTPLSAVFVENIQIGHDTRRLVEDCAHLFELADKLDSSVELWAVLPDEATGAQSHIVKSLEPGMPIGEVLVGTRLEPVVAMAMVIQMLEAGILGVAALPPDEPTEEEDEDAETLEVTRNLTSKATTGREDTAETEVIEGARARDLARAVTEIIDPKPRKPRRLGDLIKARTADVTEEAQPGVVEEIEEEEAEEAAAAAPTEVVEADFDASDIDVQFRGAGRHIHASSSPPELAMDWDDDEDDEEGDGDTMGEFLDTSDLGLVEQDTAEGLDLPEDDLELDEAQGDEDDDHPPTAEANGADAARDEPELEGSPDDEDIADEPSAGMLSSPIDPTRFIEKALAVDEMELEAFADHDHVRGNEDDGLFTTEVHNLDRIEVVTLAGRQASERHDEDEDEDEDEGDEEDDDLDQVGEAPTATFSAKVLSQGDAAAKIGVANEAIGEVIRAFDASEGAGRGRATLQILLDGSPAKFGVLFQGVRLDGDKVPVSALMNNLGARPQSEHRQLLNQGLVDLIERALSLAMDEIGDDDLIDELLEATAGYRQRIGL